MSQILHVLVDHRNTMIVTEHTSMNQHRLVAMGTPEEVARVKASHTGQFLVGVLGRK